MGLDFSKLIKNFYTHSDKKIHFDDTWWNSAINIEVFNNTEIRRSYINNGFAFIPGAIKRKNCQELYDQMEFKPTRKASQFFRSHSAKSLIPSECMNHLIKHLEIVCNHALYPSYAFGISYSKKKGDMVAHYDTFANPVSITLCINSSDNDLCNTLFIDPLCFNNPYLQRVTIKKGFDSIANKCPLDLKVGDIGIFRGREHLHWREKTESTTYSAILCHYYDYQEAGIRPPNKNHYKSFKKLYKGRETINSYQEFIENYSLFIK